MSTRLIREQNDNILLKNSKDVVELTDHLKELIQDMKDTMKNKKGCGLAAVQVGILRNIIVVQPEEDKGIYTYINPKITWYSKEKEKGVEGCLSVVGKKGVVERSVKIRFTALDEQMKENEYEAEGFQARIIQHEVDHLNGRLYTSLVEGKLYNTEDKIPGYEDEEDDNTNDKVN